MSVNSIIPIPEAKTTFDFVFNLSKNPYKELYLRNRWSSMLCPSKDQEIIRTRCSYTYIGLMSAFFGTKYMRLGKIENVFEAVFKKNARSVFVVGFILTPAYFLSPDKGSKEYFGGHGFVVVKYLTTRGEPRFRLFQSSVKNYSLQESIEAHSNDLSWSEFSEFMNELNDLKKIQVMTDAFKSFCKRYFHYETDIELGSTALQSIQLRMIGDVISCQELEGHKKSFENFLLYLK